MLSRGEDYEASSIESSKAVGMPCVQAISFADEVCNVGYLNCAGEPLALQAVYSVAVAIAARPAWPNYQYAPGDPRSRFSSRDRGAGTGATRRPNAVRYTGTAKGLRRAN
jgi:hypothetical protein